MINVISTFIAYRQYSRECFMFWLAFVSIILFIIFLIVILVSTTRTSTNKTLTGLKDDLDAKNKTLDEKQPRAKKTENKVPIEPEEVEEKAAVAVAVVPEVEAPVVVEEIPEPVVEVSAPVEQEVLIEEEVPFVEEFEEAIEPVVEEEPSIMEPFIEEEPEAAEERPAAVEEELLEVPMEPVPVDVVLEEPAVEVEEEIIVEEEVPSKPEKTEEAAVEEQQVPAEEEPAVEELQVEEDTYTYEVFDNARTMEEFGLSKEEANDFIIDLIQQIEDEMPGLEEAVSASDTQKIEDVSHMIKGSATNLGTGGIADVLVDFNTYMKTGSDSSVVAGHMRNLRRALTELKEQFQ